MIETWVKIRHNSRKRRYENIQLLKENPEVIVRVEKAEKEISYSISRKRNSIFMDYG